MSDAAAPSYEQTFKTVFWIVMMVAAAFVGSIAIIIR